MKKLFRFFSQALFVVGVPLLAWFNLSASIMAVCAIVLVVLFGKLESLVEFSFGPLRAKIERNLSESEVLLENLKRFASIQARSANSASVHTGRFASKDDWIFQSVKRNENGLIELGLDPSQIAEARSDFVRITIGDAGRAATGGARIPQKLGDEAVAEWQALRREKINDPDAIAEFLSKWGVLSDERQKRIDDMRWMIEHQDVRDADQYMRAHAEVQWD